MPTQYTPKRRLRYPQGPDPAAVPADVQNLATDLENVALVGVGTSVSRPAPSADPGNTVGTKGSLYVSSDTGAVSVTDGKDWKDVSFAGEVRMFAGSAAPAGWLLCQGQAVSRNIYSALFSIIGTAYGAGDGSNTFNLPDLQARMPMGAGASRHLQSNIDQLGQAAGAEYIALSINEMPYHDHGGNTGNQSALHSHVGVTDGQGDHQHTLSGNVPIYNTAYGGAGVPGVAGGSTYGFPRQALGADWAGNHAHNVYTQTESVWHTHPIGAQGANWGHSNMPPYQAVNFIIRF